jgi:GMP synthase (glutamine-hydrolysing)
MNGSSAHCLDRLTSARSGAIDGAMKTCLALRHVHFEDLGLFAEPLRRRGYAIRYIDTPLEALEAGAAVEADLVVVLGGPVGAYQVDLYPWLGAEIEGLRLRLAAERPTLGVCLGAQLMATALGASVAPGPAPEIGWSPLSLTDAGRASPLASLAGLPVLHWHGDRFDLPDGAARLASTELCPHQAFALGRYALALQFHAEVDPARFEPWLVANASEIAGLGLHPNDLRRATRAYGPAMMKAAPALIDAWLNGLGG